MIGTVTLVGAGPGAPGLLTLDAMEAISRAQVVVYDRLVDSAVLALIPPEARTVDAGKQADHHLIPQEEINEILLRSALDGNDTVRLKGGDPFLFGRGGEEMEFLAAHGVPFREIPGITSALAVPAYAGIPVTHRNCSSSVHIVTGHARAGHQPDIDFQSLVRCGGTLVFLMSVTGLEMICNGLLEAGLDPGCPAAIIEQGTTPKQRRILATACTLAEEARAQDVHSPAISVFGAVCALSETLDWYDRLPLRGKTIVVTRPRERAGSLSRRLRELGADVAEYPCIRTEAISPCPEMERALRDLTPYRWLVFTSATGVEIFSRCLDGLGLDARAAAGVLLAAIGPGTAAALRRTGLRPDLMPEIYDAAHLGEALARDAGGRVLILRAERGSPDLTAALDARDIPYDDVACYRTVIQSSVCPDLRDLLKRGAADLAVFTSTSTVEGFCAAAGGDADLSSLTGVCIGPGTAKEAEKHHIRTVTAETATVDGLVRAVLRAGRKEHE